MLETTTTGEQSSPREPARPSGQRRVAWPTKTAWVYALVFLLTAGIIAFNILRPITVLPRIAPAPGYAFTDQQGELVTSETQRGRLTLYSFTYADCGDQCAQTAAQIAATQAALAERIPADVDMDLVTISVNPEHDNPERLAQLKQQHTTATTDSRVPWKLLSGDLLRTRMAVGQGFGVYFAEQATQTGGDGHSVTFDPRYVLVDGWGVMRAEYRTATPDPEILERDVNLLVQEARNSSGLIKLGYEAAHLFACYPR